MRKIIEEQTVRAGAVKERNEIEEEIRQRQERWRSRAREETPSTEDKGQPSIPGAAVVIESEEPPPTSFLSSDKGS